MGVARGLTFDLHPPVPVRVSEQRACLFLRGLWPLSAYAATAEQPTILRKCFSSQLAHAPLCNTLNAPALPAPADPTTASQHHTAMAAQQRNKFCLAAALFGFPPADGYAEPTQQVPDSWLRLFEERADDKLRAGLAMSCKAGRAYYTPDQMVVSGPDGSKVVTFTIDDSFGSLTSTASLAKAAGKRHADVVELVLRRAPRARRVRLVQAVVDQVLGCFASTLRSVDLDSALYEPFPSPSQLPKLRTLSICTSAGSTISSLAAHTQLTSLQLYYEMSEYQAGYVPPFPLILLPGPTAYALCHLTTNENLDNQLLSLLTQRTPSLTHLTVHELALTHSAASSEWGVVQLNLTDDGGHDIEAEQLIWLPKQRGGVVLTVTTELLGVCFEEITEQVRMHTTHWCLCCFVRRFCMYHGAHP